MTIWIAVVALALSAGTAFATPNCTSEPKSKWLDKDAFKSKVAALGYEFNSVKTAGSCYEIYGRDKTGKRVEVYFNPITAAIVEEHKN